MTDDISNIWKDTLRRANEETNLDGVFGQQELCAGIARKLMKSHTWSDTPEGHDFWEYVYMRLVYLGGSND